MKKFFTGRWIITHLVVIIVVIVLINLGFWQLRRLEQRRAVNAQILAGLNAPVTTLTGQPIDPEGLHRHRMTVTGTFDNEENIALMNRPFNGMAGMRLVTPLRIAGSEQAVLVDRGWIPLQETQPAQRRQFDETGTVSVEGIAYKSQPQPDRSLIPKDPVPGPGDKRRDQWFRVDIDLIQRQLPYPLLPVYIQQSPAEGASLAIPPLRQENFELDEGNHLSYALQWFGFALAAVGVYGGVLWQEIKKTQK
jgi:surfeit locus 1 family protein